MSYHKTPTPTRYWDNSIHYVTQRAIALVLRYATNVYQRRISLLSADEDIVRAFCEKGLRTYNNRYLGPTTCETVWFLPRTYEKKIKNLELV